MGGIVSGLFGIYRPFGMLSFSGSISYLDENVPTHIEHNLLFAGGTPPDITKAKVSHQMNEIQVRLHPMLGSFFFGFGLMDSITSGFIAAHLTDNTKSFERELGNDTKFYGVTVGNIWNLSGLLLGAECGGVY